MKYITLIVSSMLLVFLLCGCTTLHFNNSQPNNNCSSLIVNGESMTSSEITNSQINLNAIKVHQISRDDFQNFLKSPSLITLEESDSLEVSYLEEGEFHITTTYTRFHFRKELVDFLKDKNKIQHFLKQNCKDDIIENMVVLDAPQTPMTIWLETPTESIYVTINEYPDDISYVYRCYSQSEYCDRYILKNGKLIVNGKEIKLSNLPKIYYNYADLPLISVLHSLGAQINQKGDSYYDIYFKDKVYKLNLEKTSLTSIENKTDNLLYKIDGGVYFIYRSGNELMVDSNVLLSLLRSM